jgi:hypothetical protein
MLEHLEQDQSGHTGLLEVTISIKPQVTEVESLDQLIQIFTKLYPKDLVKTSLKLSILVQPLSREISIELTVANQPTRKSVI